MWTDQYYTTAVSHSSITYRIIDNFWMAKFSKKAGCQTFRKQNFRKQSRDLASCHYYSVISKIYFQKLLVIFKFFVNKIIQKLPVIQYTLWSTYVGLKWIVNLLFRYPHGTTSLLVFTYINSSQKLSYYSTLSILYSTYVK